MSVLDDLGVYLAAQGLGLTVGTNLFVGRRLPDAPDVAVGLILYGGREPVYAHTSSGIAWERPRVQLMSRQAAAVGGDAAAETLANNVFKSLGSVHNQTINGTYYINIWPQQSPFQLPPDAKDRPTYGFNVECEKYLT